jgi:hypothetical protein
MIVNGLQDFQLEHVITAIGGLGTAAFGLVEAAKSAPFFKINHIGFSHIEQVVASVTPEGGSAGKPLNSLRQTNILENLKANWANGTDLASQKSIAKSLIKLHLSEGSAAKVAARTNVDPDLLSAVAAKIAGSTALSQPESDAYARFDLIVTALLDEAYQLSDQKFRNWTRTLAAVVAVMLALAGAWSLDGTERLFWHRDLVAAFIVGLLATPLAPIAKDISTALATAVNTMQLVKK